VVCINSFTTDTAEEIKVVKRAVEAAGAHCAVSTHWAQVGKAPLEPGRYDYRCLQEKQRFQFLYPTEMKLRQRVEKIATTSLRRGRSGLVAGSRSESQIFSKATRLYDDYSTMTVKTQLS